MATTIIKENLVVKNFPVGQIFFIPTSRVKINDTVPFDSEERVAVGTISPYSLKQKIL